VAVKIVSLQQDSKQLGLLVKEIEALSMLKHENIINYRGSYKLNNTLWIIMDYLEGKLYSPIHQTDRQETKKHVFYVSNTDHMAYYWNRTSASYR